MKEMEMRVNGWTNEWTSSEQKIYIMYEAMYKLSLLNLYLNQ